MENVDTEIVKQRYDRIAFIYDYMDLIVTKKQRIEMLKMVRGEVLEVGVGTGRNLPLYPPGSSVTGIDISPAMLNKARQRILKSNLNVRLEEMDVQSMPFDNGTFDTVVATCVFCSVPDPVAGLKEVKRVCRHDGQIILIEHVRSETLIGGVIMDLINPINVRIIGNNINRKTVENVQRAGLNIIEVRNLLGRIVKLIRASP
jgi:ubiquinone/menaquinone biosynthesis C-methylase UbiE